MDTTEQTGVDSFTTKRMNKAPILGAALLLACGFVAGRFTKADGNLKQAYIDGVNDASAVVPVMLSNTNISPTINEVFRRCYAHPGRAKYIP